MALTLDEVSEHFRQWRSSKKPREPVPSELWDKVAEIAGQYSMSKIASRLGISYIQYKSNIPPRLSKSFDPIEHIHFVNLPPTPPPPAVAVEKKLVLEFSRGDGASVKCHCLDVDMMRYTLSWFLKGG